MEPTTEMTSAKNTSAIERAPVVAGQIRLSSFNQLWTFIQRIVQTDFVPAAYRNKPFEALACVQYGSEIGLGIMQSLRWIAVINGMPSAYGDGLIGLVHASGKVEYFKEYFDEDTMTAHCEAKRTDQDSIFKYSYSKQDAITAQLWNKKTKRGKDTPWVTSPKRMLQHRARGFVLRDGFADVLGGLITREEAQDYPQELEIVDDGPSLTDRLEAEAHLYLDEPPPIEEEDINQDAAANQYPPADDVFPESETTGGGDLFGEDK